MTTTEEMEAEEAEEVEAAKDAFIAAYRRYADAGVAMQQARRRYVSAHDKAYRRRAAAFEDHAPVELSLWLKVTRPLCPDCLRVVQPDDTWHTVSVDSGDPVPTFSCDDGPVLY